MRCDTGIWYPRGGHSVVTGIGRGRVTGYLVLKKIVKTSHEIDTG